MPDWDKIYQEKEVADATAAQVLLNNNHLLPNRGRALDYACGLAGNGIYLAGRGFEVSAWDNSRVAVDKVNTYARKYNLNLRAEQKDLEQQPPVMQAQYDMIIVSFFLHRESLRNLYAGLKKGGLLFYQTFSGEQQQGRGPSNPNFRLQTNELLKVFSDMQLLHYREDDGAVQTLLPDSDQVYFIARAP